MARVIEINFKRLEKSIFQSLPDRLNMIENSENQKKMYFWVSDLIDDQLIKKKSTPLFSRYLSIFLFSYRYFRYPKILIRIDIYRRYSHY